MNDATMTVEEVSRDRLALDRTRLANERTMLAYVRTAIMLGATGVTLLSLYADGKPTIIGMSWLLIAAGIVTLYFGLARFRRMAAELQQFS